MKIVLATLTVFVGVVAFRWLYNADENHLNRRKNSEDPVKKKEVFKMFKIQTGTNDYGAIFEGDRDEENILRVSNDDLELLKRLNNDQTNNAKILKNWKGDLNALRNKIKLNYSSLDVNKLLRSRSEVLLSKLSWSSQIGMVIRDSEQFKSELENFVEKLHPEDHHYHVNNWRYKFNLGVLAIGVNKFLFAVEQFCKDEARGDEIEILSIGSGDGTLDGHIMEAYRRQYGHELRIVLIDHNPSFKVDFRTTDEIMEKRPNIVGNCALLIIWPEPDHRNDNYDIEAILKLQPHAALILYEVFGSSGSHNLKNLLYNDSLELSPSEFGEINFWDKWLILNGKYEMPNYGLEHYSIEEVACQKVQIDELIGTRTIRLVKLKRTEKLSLQK